MTQQHGIKIALPGEDATTVPDSYVNIKKFSLLSSVSVAEAGFSLLKQKMAVRVSIADGATETVAHGLDYTPIVWVFIKNGSSNLVPVYDNTSSTYMYVDATNLVIHNQNGATRDFYYYVFYDAI
jgi:hypothetical protein